MDKKTSRIVTLILEQALRSPQDGDTIMGRPVNQIGNDNRTGLFPKRDIFPNHGKRYIVTRYGTEPSIYIGAGDYQIVTGNKKVNLNALLSTCTGVALYDRATGMGGLCHILLPDVPGHDYSWAPKVYATPCLNLLLDDLLEAGADLAGIKAVVAGGCLPSPCSRQDINLDIGGRTRDCVYHFLAQHNIPIIDSKTGGCFGMTLTLNTSRWQATISPITKTRGEKGHAADSPSLSQIKEKISHLKPVPQVALKTMRLLTQENYQLKEITRELSLDQVLSAKVISFCNSPYIGSTVKIDSIERAALLLGETHLIEIILSTSLRDFYNQQEGGYSLIRGGLFKHSLLVAFLTEIISDYHEKLDRQTSYTAGLLHDIGKVALDQHVAENISLFYDQDKCLTASLINKERELFGIDHQEMGRELALLWAFPENLKEVASLHHNPEKAHMNKELTYAVYLADLLASGFMSGQHIDAPDDTNLNTSITILGLDLPDLEQIIARIPWDKIDSL